MNNDEGHKTENRFADMNEREFAALGGGHIGYIREFVQESEAPLLEEETVDGEKGPVSGVRLFALHNADGQPIIVSDNRDEVIANAFRQNLMPLTVH